MRVSNDQFNRAQSNWDNMSPPEDPVIPDELVREMVQEKLRAWQTDIPDWLWDEAWQELANGE